MTAQSATWYSMVQTSTLDTLSSSAKLRSAASVASRCVFVGAITGAITGVIAGALLAGAAAPALALSTSRRRITPSSRTRYLSTAMPAKRMAAHMAAAGVGQ